MSRPPRNLATREFWSTEYLPAYDLPSRPDEAVPFDRCIAAAIAAEAPARPGQRLLELGCAPGRWMVFYADRFGAAVEGIEYTSLGAAQTRSNLAACRVEGVVYEADLWDWEAPKPYDLVLSQGFIEHFDDIDTAFARHVSLVRPGGRLVLEVPNFQGINRALQARFDPAWLAVHNMAAMGHRGHLARAAEHGLEVLACRYVGGFDPDVISVRQRGRKLLAPFWHLRRRGIGDDLNHRWWSSSLLMVFRRPS